MNTYLRTIWFAVILGGRISGFSTDLFASDVGTNAGFQLEVEVSIVEKAASDSALPVAGWAKNVPWSVMDNALARLHQHYSLWANNPSIPPRLGKAVLAIFPSLTNASMSETSNTATWIYVVGIKGSQPGNQMWCNAVSMLAMTHDLAMIDVLRPFLENKLVAGDGTYSPEDRTPLRACDKAAIAITRLLGDKHDPYVGFAMSCAGLGNVRDSYPKWDEWDKQIAGLQKRLDVPPKK